MDQDPRWICDWCWRWNSPIDIHCHNCGRDIMVSSLKAAKVRKNIRDMKRKRHLRRV